MVSPTSTRCIPASRTKRFSCTLSKCCDDPRDLPLHLRKTNLERLLARPPDGIIVAPFERGEIGRTYSGRPAAWARGVGLQTPRWPYRGGRQKQWVKVKNRSHPALTRVLEAFR